MLVILPFEKDFYAKYNYKAVFVGHPLLDAIDNEKFQSKENFIRSNKLSGKPIIALLPGSRKQEVAKMLEIMLSVEHNYSEYQFVIAGVESLGEEFYRPLINKTDSKIVYGQTHSLVANSVAALVTSGTATLETAIIGTPEVVCYRGNWISVGIAKRIVDIKYISLVNLIMDKLLVAELIQSELNTKNLISELDKILDGQIREKMILEFADLRKKLGNKGASERAADEIFSLLK
jgi:lipid-A-disaccharide synthase